MNMQRSTKTERFSFDQSFARSLKLQTWSQNTYLTISALKSFSLTIRQLVKDNLSEGHFATFKRTILYQFSGIIISSVSYFIKCKVAILVRLTCLSQAAQVYTFAKGNN